MLVGEADNQQGKDRVRAREKTTVKERVPEGKESWVVLGGL